MAKRTGARPSAAKRGEVAGTIATVPVDVRAKLNPLLGI